MLAATVKSTVLIHTLSMQFEDKEFADLYGSQPPER